MKTCGGAEPETVVKVKGGKRVRTLQVSTYSPDFGETEPKGSTRANGGEHSYPHMGSHQSRAAAVGLGDAENSEEPLSAVSVLPLRLLWFPEVYYSSLLCRVFALVSF